MEKDGLIENIRDNLDERRVSETHKKTDAIDRMLIQKFKEVEAAKDVGLTLDAFDAVITDMAQYYLNHPEIEGDVHKSAKELGLARETFQKIHRPETYKSVAEEHRGEKTTIRGRPKDQVHQFFSAQISRIKNQCRTISSDARVGLNYAQMSCLRSTRRAYEKLQDQAMGVEPRKAKNKAKNKGKEIEM